MRKFWIRYFASITMQKHEGLIFPPIIPFLGRDGRGNGLIIVINICAVCKRSSNDVHNMPLTARHQPSTHMITYNTKKSCQAMITVACRMLPASTHITYYYIVG